MRHETVKAITERRLNKVLEAFSPTELDMNHWGIKTSCGTTCCLAGKAALLFAPTVVRWEPSLFDYYTHLLKGASFAAQHALSLNWEQTQVLFAAYLWPPNFEKKYIAAKTGRGRLSALKARVKHFIATGE